MSALISVIVPVYNVEQYLEECVESILKQTYSNIEVILVDDGSTDKSGSLCNIFEKKDCRVKVIHKLNGGLSHARNVGLEQATGDYVSFIDGDDIVSMDFIEMLYECIEKHHMNISACGYCHYYNSGKIRKINYSGIKKYFKDEEAQIFLNIIGYYNVSVCNKLFHKSLFDSIKFPVGKKSEDWYVMYLLLEKSGGIYYDSDIKYFYRQRQGSITKSININYDSILAAKKVYEYYIEKRLLRAIPYAAQSLAFAYMGIYNMYLCKTKNKQKMKKIKKEVYGIRKNITFSKISKIRKVQLFLFLHCINVYNICFKFFDLKRQTLYK